MFSLIINYFQNLYRYNKAVDELLNLNDKELKDLGIYRSSIPYVVAESIYNSYK